jgi:hypothetical protein
MAAYGTDDGFTAWLAAQGHTLPVGAPTSAVLRARASAYVDGYERVWTGQRTGGVAQELAWPRIGATMNCTVAIDDDVIPPAVVNATYRAAWLEASTPGVLTGSPVASGGRVKRERIEGAVDVEYFDDGRTSPGAGPMFVDSVIDGLLSPFICNQAGGAFLWTLGC